MPIKGTQSFPTAAIADASSIAPGMDTQKCLLNEWMGGWVDGWMDEC